MNKKNIKTTKTIPAKYTPSVVPATRKPSNNLLMIK